MRYFAKPDGWFVAGTEVILDIDLENGSGIFYGLREKHREDCRCVSKKIGGCQTRAMDEELCPLDEFDLIEGEPTTRIELEKLYA